MSLIHCRCPQALLLFSGLIWRQFNISRPMHLTNFSPRSENGRHSVKRRRAAGEQTFEE